MEENVKVTTELWEEFDKGKTYQSSIGMTTRLPQCVNFFEGRQWANTTDEATRSLPRPVENIVKPVCRNKKSQILGTPTRIVCKNYNMDDSLDRFNHFIEYLQKEMDMERANNIALDDGTIKGTYVYHFYWDQEAHGLDASQDGALRVEIIDPLNIVVANPNERDTQKQKYIIIRTFEDVDTLKAQYPKFKEDIVADDQAEETDYNIAEDKSNGKVSVLTKYYRIGGEVYWCRGTKSIMLNKGTRLAPDVESAYKMLSEVDAPNNSLPDSEKEEELTAPRVLAPLYPVNICSYEKRQDCIYGIGEAEGLIANQKAINFLRAMQIMNIQNNAWGKYKVLPGALQDQVIDNTPGQVVVDYTGTGNGIAKMTEQPLHNEVSNVIDQMISNTKNLAGAGEFLTGEALKGTLSGTAIAQMQQASAQPIKNLQDNYWLYQRMNGRIIIQYAKTHYTNLQFSYEEEVEVKDNQGQVMLDEFGDVKMEKTTINDTFNSSEYQDSEFDVVVETMAGSLSTTMGDIQLLENMYNKGDLTAMKYVECLPDNAISNKEQIIKALREGEKSAQVQLAQANQIIQQQQQTIDQQTEAVNDAYQVIKASEKQRETLVKLYQEASEKIQQSNLALSQMNADCELLSEVAVKELQRKGLIPNQQ